MFTILEIRRYTEYFYVSREDIFFKNKKIKKSGLSKTAISDHAILDFISKTSQKDFPAYNAKNININNLLFKGQCKGEMVKIEDFNIQDVYERSLGLKVNGIIKIKIIRM